MAAPQNVIALVFDFDDTLTDESATLLLQSRGIDAKQFWQEDVDRLVKDGWDPTVAYLTVLLDHVGDGKPFGGLTNQHLREFGRGLQFYPGIPDLFEDLKEQVRIHRTSSPSIEFFVVSSGLEEIIRGTSIAPHFQGIIGCRYEEEQGGRISRIRNVLSFTEKTKYLYAINKGCEGVVRTEPYAVNRFMAPADRRVPFKNMIYVGDGLTDVPCFSLVDAYGGKAFGVFDPAKEGSPKKAWEQLVVPRRVQTMNSPRYRKTDDLGALLRAAVEQICLDLDVRTGTTER